MIALHAAAVLVLIHAKSIWEWVKLVKYWHNMVLIAQGVTALQNAVIHAKKHWIISHVIPSFKPMAWIVRLVTAHQNALICARLTCTKA